MSIENVLSQYQVSDILTKLGISFEEKTNTLVACCPFHSEKTPSFSIFKSSGYYNCFGCGKNGSIYKLVQELSGKNIYTFLDIKNNYVPRVEVVRERKSKELKNVELVIEGDFLNIFDNQFVLDYCWSIGFTNEFIETFNISYAKSIKIYPPNTEERDRKAFYNRIIIPCTYNGKIYNYECRDYTRRSSKKVLYPLGTEPDILFNYDNLDFDKPVFITEGIKGLARIWSYYSKNVVSTFGKIVKDHQRKLIEKIPNICVVPDNDENKINKKTNLPIDNVQITLDAYDEFYPNEYQIAYIPYKGKDPNDLTRSQMKTILDNRRWAKDIIIDRHWPKDEPNNFFTQGLI